MNLSSGLWTCWRRHRLRSAVAAVAGTNGGQRLADSEYAACAIRTQTERVQTGMPPKATRPGLLRLDARTCKGLSWVRHWARAQLTAHKRARKYRLRETGFEPEEAELLTALVDLERACNRLLEGQVRPPSPGGPLI